MKITALTVCCVDYFPELNKTYIGGNSLNFATQCKKSGINEVSIVGAIGNDNFGKLIEHHLSAYNINKDHLYKTEYATASNRIFIAENGDRYFKPESWNGGAFDKFRLGNDDLEFLQKQDVVAINIGDPNLQTILKNKLQHQLLVVDFMDCREESRIIEIIDKIDICFVSADINQLKTLRQISDETGKKIIATLGAKGSVAFFEGESYSEDAPFVEEVIDTTGCGDAFQAAYTISWWKNKNIKAALKKGSEAAAKILTFTGACQ